MYKIESGNNHKCCGCGCGRIDIPDLLERARTVMSEYFNNKFEDDTIVELMHLVLDEINYVTPMTYYSLCDAPKHWGSALIVGLKFFLLLSLQETLALKDFNYSDQGLSLTINRVQNLEVPIKTTRAMFEKIAWDLKKPYILRMGPKMLTTPRYQQTISGFMRVLYGVSWSR